MQLFVLQFSSPPDGIKATARHILVKSPEQVDVVMEKLSDGVPFASVAADFSTCPSKSQEVRWEALVQVLWLVSTTIKNTLRKRERQPYPLGRYCCCLLSANFVLVFYILQSPMIV